MTIRPIKTSIFQEGENLFAFITGYFKKIPEKSVIAVTSKIVALAEKRTAIIKDGRTKERWIKRESQLALSTKYCWLTIKDNLVMPSAGIDESNANGKLILLPKDSFKAARLLCQKLQRKYRVKRLGVLITDSRTIPLRAGIIGVTLGYAGFCGVKDYRGRPDIFGRKFHFSRVDLADSLAAAAVLTMGEGREQQPLAIIKNAPVEFCDRVHARELQINIKDDMYRPLFLNLPKK